MKARNLYEKGQPSLTYACALKSSLLIAVPPGRWARKSWHVSCKSCAVQRLPHAAAEGGIMNVQGRKRMPSLALTAIVAAMAAAGFAQERSSAPDPFRTAETTLSQWLADKDVRISELIGRRVTDPSGTDLGEVEDVLATAGRE